MLKIIKRIKLILLAPVAALFLSGCVLDVHDDHHSGHRGVYYHYDYYPTYEVYYNRRDHVYWYRHRSRWVRNRHSPHRLRMRRKQPYHNHHNWRRYKYKGNQGRRHKQKRNPRHW